MLGIKTADDRKDPGAEGAITKVLSSDKKTRHLVLTWQDIEMLETVQKVLKPLQDFTDAFQGRTM